MRLLRPGATSCVAVLVQVRLWINLLKCSYPTMLAYATNPLGFVLCLISAGPDA